MTLTRSLVVVLVLHIVVAYDKRLEERVDALQDHVKTITKHVLHRMDQHLEWVESNEDFIRWVANNSFPPQENLTRVLQSLDKRLSRMEEMTEQLQERLPRGVSINCPSGYMEIAGKCMFFSRSTGGYDEAVNACSLAGGRLAVIDNCNLLHAVAQHLENAGLDHFWVGATDEEEEGNWVWGDGSKVQMGATFWGRVAAPNHANEPSGGLVENCLLMSAGDNYLFGDSNCDTHVGKSPLCQYDEHDNCTSPRVRLEGRCVEFLTGLQVDWSEANTKCVHNGGHLAKVDDCNFLGSLITYILSSGLTPNVGYWLGGTDIAEEGTWLWEDSSPVTMGTPFWGKDGSGVLQPDNYEYNEHCCSIEIKNGWRLNDLKCWESKYHAACEAGYIIR